MAVNMDSKFDRFKVEPRGGYFANTVHNFSSFEKKVSIYLISMIQILFFYRTTGDPTNQREKTYQMEGPSFRWN